MSEQGRMSAEQTPAIERVLAEHTLHASMNICTCGNWRATPGAGALHDQHRAHVAQALAPVLDAAVREEAERIAQAIEKRRNEHWQKHLREHPYADGSSCPGDYAAHDAYYDAARIARADRVAEPQHEAATSGKESEASDE